MRSSSWDQKVGVRMELGGKAKVGEHKYLRVGKENDADDC